MTDARLPERYLMDRRIHRLTADDFRSFVMSLVWSVSNRTDGVVLPEDLVLIPGFGRAAPAALVGQKLWEQRSDGSWLILDYAAHQTSRSELEILENTRRRDRLKKQKQRASKAAGSSSVPGDIPGDESPGTAQDRKGEDRRGQERHVVDRPTSQGDGHTDVTRDSSPKSVPPDWKSRPPKPRRSCDWCRDGKAIDPDEICPTCHQSGERGAA